MYNLHQNLIVNNNTLLTYKFKSTSPKMQNKLCHRFWLYKFIIIQTCWDNNIHFTVKENDENQCL